MPVRSDMGQEVETIAATESRSLFGFWKSPGAVLFVRETGSGDFKLRHGICKRIARCPGRGNVPPSRKQPANHMKVIRKGRKGESREALLKEYFLTASLLALLKRVGEEAAKAIPRGIPQPQPVKVRR